MVILKWTHALMFLGSVYVCLCFKDTNFCKDPTSPAGIPNRMRPNVTNMFHTWVECVIVNKNKTTDIHEYFDADHNRGFIEQTDESIRFDELYSYDSNELIGFYPDYVNKPLPPFLPGGKCSVSDLSKSGQRFLLGYGKVNGQPHIFSANDALHLSGKNVNEVYMGVTSVRGIYVDWWTSCQYWANMDATMTVNWYFTSQTAWSSSVGPGQSIPVMAHVTGIVHNGTQPAHNFEHYYNFFQFKPREDEVHSKKYETPAGLQCPGRKRTKKLPKLADEAFSYTAEILDLNRNRTSVMKVAFLYHEKLVKLEQRSDDGKSDLIEVHDFHAGLAYITDKQRGNCTVRVIGINDFDVRSAGGNDVRIRSAKELFYFDSSHVTYEGIKTNRKIECDTWIGRRTDYPFFSPSNSTWEWYFASNDWQYTAAGPELGGIPVQMRMKVPAFGWNYHYNIYNFKKETPDLLSFDISGCYNSSQRQRIQFKLPETNRSILRANDNLFKQAVLEAAVQSTKVSPLRVAHLQVSYADPITVTFDLLDVSPPGGNTLRSRNYMEVPLDYAATTLKQMIQHGQFVIQINGYSFQQLTAFVALPMESYETTSQPTTETPSTRSQTTTETPSTGADSIFCFACEDVISLSYCLDIKLCNQEEVCFTERYVNHASHIRYKSGCKKAQECDKPKENGSGFLSNTNSDLCQHCCSKDFCNSAGCGDSGFPPLEERGPICFDCNRVTSIGQCDEVVPCKSSQVCSAKGFSWFGDQRLYFHGCEDKLDCPKTDSIAKRSIPVCHSCCTDDYCNRNCTKQAVDYSIIG